MCGRIIVQHHFYIMSKAVIEPTCNMHNDNHKEISQDFTLFSRVMWSLVLVNNLSFQTTNQVRVKAQMLNSDLSAQSNKKIRSAAQRLKGLTKMLLIERMTKQRQKYKMESRQDKNGTTD